jgi:imidazolonepropionase-like amidohydrolase
VREHHAQGIKFVKLWLEDRGGYQIPGEKGPFVLTQASYSAAIKEAHRLGMRTIAHVKTLADTKAMIRAGLDIQTHPIQDYPVDAELIALVKARPEAHLDRWG